MILLDIMMPGLNGIKVCRRLKLDPRLKAIPVIMVSARGQEADVIAGLDAGAGLCHQAIQPVGGPRGSGPPRTKTDHDRQIEQNRALAEVATIDSLTSARNRRFLDDALIAAVSFAVRSVTSLSLAMLDVDTFKQYNDAYGHPAGDEVLRTVSRLLREGLREHDVVARYGGEEFALLMPATDGESARAITDRLRLRLASNHWPRRNVTASFGVATMLPDEPMDPAILIGCRDAASLSVQTRRSATA